MSNKETWDAYIRTLPDDVRLGLAEYAAQMFLDGVQKGRDELRANIIIEFCSEGTVTRLGRHKKIHLSTLMDFLHQKVRPLQKDV